MKKFSKQKIDYTRMALSLAGLVVGDAGAELVLQVTSEIDRLGGKFSILDAAKIEAYICKKYNVKKTPKKIEAEPENKKRKS